VVSSVEEANLKSDMRIYPNPVTSGPLTIEFPSEVREGEISFVDENGRIVHSISVLNTKTLSIQLENKISRGLYFVIFRGDGKKDQGKIILHY
jgi:hypothetical protein